MAPTDPVDVDAFILAWALVSMGAGRAAADAAYVHATGVAADAANVALAHLEAGDWVGVVG